MNDCYSFDEDDYHKAFNNHLILVVVTNSVLSV